MEKRKDWVFRALLTSDRHIDHPDSDWALQKQHLEEAAALGAPVLDAGDLLCVMQSKFDKRSSKSALKVEHLRDNYIDAVIEDTAEKLAPWANLMPVILSGNHEQAVSERFETSISDRLCERLKTLTGATVYHGGYGAAISFAFVGADKRTHTVNVWLEHGAGGGGVITADMIALFRKTSYLSDFQIIGCGHTHDKWSRTIHRLRRTQSGKLFEEEVVLVKLGTYKREYHSGHGGWATRRGGAPKPVGAYWVEFRWCTRTDRIIYRAVEA